MKIYSCLPAFTDARGVITDLLRDTSVENVTLITTCSGSVRGNHYHTEATVYVYVLGGQFKVRSKLVRPVGELRQVTVEVGNLVMFEPYELHTLEALVDSNFLLMAHGRRGGQFTVQEILK